MSFPFVLAHGELGRYDELLFLAIVIVFLIMMGVAWVKSYNQTPGLARRQDSDNDQPETTTAETESPDYFQLE